MMRNKIFSLILVLTLLLSVLAPWGGILQANAALYGSENLMQVIEPVIGESYYLAANVNGTLKYFCTPPTGGSVTTTLPYSLYTTESAAHTQQVTLEDPTTAIEGTAVGFQLTYNNNGNTARIYCYDAKNNDGIMDTGANSANYKGRHTFEIAEVGGVKVLRKLVNKNILVVKYNETKGEWRMLGVPQAELSNEGVYPAMLLQEHTHSFVDGSCVCGKREPVSLQEGIYYLTGTVNGQTYYFRQTGTGEKVTYTTPYSLYTTSQKTDATLLDVIQEQTGSFSLAYPYNGNTARIYVYDISTDGTVDTGVNTKNQEAYHHFLWDSENAVFYQMEGQIKYVLALKELKNTNTNVNQIRIQAVPESQLSSTVVAVRPEAHTQHSCDTWVIDTPATAGSAGLKTGICTICGREVQEVIPALTPAFSGQSISLQEDISINVYADKAVFDEGAYRNPYVVFDQEGWKTTVSEYTQKDGCYVFTYDHITPDRMGETVKATLYADKQDGTQFSVTKEYSVAQYCYSALELEQTGDALRTLLVDTLNFGAACQIYRNSDVSAQELVNAALTEEQRAWGSGEALRELENVRDFGKNNGSVQWRGASLLMSERVQLRVYFAAGDKTDLTVRAQSASGAWTLTNDRIQSKDGMYYVDFGYVNPAQMNEKVSFTVCRGDTAVSSTMHYSIDSYAATWLGKSDIEPRLAELIKAIIRYGDATKAYVERAFDLQEDVLYLGRVYESNDTRWFNWSASGFSVQFQGSGLKAKIASNAPNATNYAYLKVYVDGVEQTDILLDKTQQTVVLAQNLDPNEIHTVEVRKRNSPRSSTAGILNLELLDGKKLAPLAAKDKLIEFVGDSLTVGYSAADVNKTESGWSTKTEDATKTYSKQVADAFNAEYMVTAISGRGVVMNNSGGSGYLLPEVYPELDIYNIPGVSYDFDLQPDVVVINLGTNDATNDGLNITTFQTGVYDFIKTVREKNPGAQIIWAYGLRKDKMTGQVAAAIEAAVAQIKAEGDSMVHYLPLALAADMHLNHPTAEAYAPSGEKLIEKIREITGW